MRPKILDPLYSSINTISGFGPHYTALFKNFIGDRYIDLLLHLPNYSSERLNIKNIKEKYLNKNVIIKATVLSKWTTYKKPRISIASVKFDNTNISIIYFNVKKSWFDSLFVKGQVLTIVGTLQFRNKKFQIVHPELVERKINAKISNYDSSYPLTTGLHKNKLKQAILKALENLPKLNEWIDIELVKSKKWSSFNNSIKNIHLPKDKNDNKNYNLFLERLAYDEALSRQLALNLIRLHKKRKRKIPKVSKNILIKKIKNILPFQLTQSQKDVLIEIQKDLTSKERMSRLLQGDVGSGKTIVAFISLLHVVEAGFQGVLMVPTEILSQQHYKFFKKYSDELGISIELLTGKNSNKKVVLHNISTGRSDIIIGTHAIIQESVNFKKLGLVVIDEQHRFGVYQRLNLLKKSTQADFLVMTATPIPRTLILTNYGDMDLSIIKNKPKNRPLVKTITVNNNKIVKVINTINLTLDSKEQIFWICPLIHESENLNLIAVETRKKSLEKYFPNKVSIIHGKMNNEEKEENLRDFIICKKPILVSTTVIEVGIDIPEASIIVIEHAERFGLSQLHQLRGRIGRGTKESICILLYDDKLTDIAKKRLTTMKNTNDGFVISEKDLEYRGPGELLGSKQSGDQSFRILDFNIHKPLIELANSEAKIITQNNPNLLGEKGDAIRNLLYLFDQDQAIELINIG